MSHDPSELILIRWFVAQLLYKSTQIIINNGFYYYYYCGSHDTFILGFFDEWKSLKEHNNKY